MSREKRRFTHILASVNVFPDVFVADNIVPSRTNCTSTTPAWVNFAGYTRAFCRSRVSVEEHATIVPQQASNTSAKSLDLGAIFVTMHLK